MDCRVEIRLMQMVVIMIRIYVIITLTDIPS